MGSDCRVCGGAIDISFLRNDKRWGKQTPWPNGCFPVWIEGFNRSSNKFLALLRGHLLQSSPHLTLVPRTKSEVQSPKSAKTKVQRPKVKTSYVVSAMQKHTCPTWL